MVEVKETGGRLGNQLFEYAFGRIVAEELGYKFTHNLKADELEKDFKLENNIPGKEFNDPVQKVDGVHKWSSSLLKEIISDKTERKIILNGFFQKYEYYKQYKEKLKEWYYFDCNKFDYSNSIGVHIRRGDFKRHPHFNLPGEYYIEILKRESFDQIFITSDELEDETVKRIQKEFKNVVLFSSSPYNTIQHFVCFKKLIISQGSFSWWIGFLSKANKIYMPNKTPPPHEIDLRVTDESRYIFV